MNSKLNIMICAVKIRLRRGENIDEILNSYPKLTAAEKKIIKNNCI